MEQSHIVPITHVAPGVGHEEELANLQGQLQQAKKELRDALVENEALRRHIALEERLTSRCV